MSSPALKSMGLVLIAALAARAAPPADPPSTAEPSGLPAILDAPAPSAESSTLPWLSTLEEGYRHALDRRGPVLVRIQTRYCPWCRQLAAQMAKPSIEDELSRWTLVDLDADESPDEIARLAVQAVPALRVLTARGRLVASRDGFLDAEELLRWLKQQRDEAAVAPDDALFGEGKPDALTLVKLTRLFGDRNPTIRESAARRLIEYPEAAAPAVIKVFRDGNLATRLTALDLLRTWRAPVGEMDPWRGETLTPDVTAALENWVEDVADVKVPVSDELTLQQLAGARDAIRRMLAAPPEEADAIRERLATFGEALLPEVYEQLAQSDADMARRRLLALRYRLAADDLRVLTWEGGMVRLAATDSQVRRRAAGELADMADYRDRALLLELFGDPDPLVREISLRGLQQTGGKEAIAALVKLLEDPSPNVRAAVLKQILQAPQQSLVPKIAEYLKSEEDADLIGHAVRFLKVAGGAAALKSLMLTLEHPQWQVRAEAAEAIGALVESGGHSNPFGHGYSVSPYSGDPFGGSSPGGIPQELIAQGYVALIELLDDPDAFVVSRSVGALESADMELAVKPLAAAAEKHPDLAATIVGILVQGENMCDKAVPHLRKFAKHEEPAVRAAAIRGLVEIRPDEMNEELLECLQDSASEVRVAAAEAVSGYFEESARIALSHMNSRDIGTNFSSWEFRDLAGSVSADTLKRMVAEAAKNIERAAADGIQDETKTSDGPSDPSNVAAEQSDQTGDADHAASDTTDRATEDSWSRWLQKHYSGKNWPESIADSIGLLEGMLEADTPEERLAAALALVPLNGADVALPVVVEAAATQRGLLDRAAFVLPWLDWESRLATFHALLEHAPNKQDREPLIHTMASIPDRHAADVFWELLADDPNLSEDLRAAAFHVALVAQPEEEALQMALTALTSEDPKRRLPALKYIADGRRALISEIGSFDLSMAFEEVDYFGRNSGQPIIPLPPISLEPEHVHPLLDHADPQVAAYAGYLLALFEQPEGLDALLAYWRDHWEDQPGLDRLVYRAVASLDDSNHVAPIEQIYERLEPYDVSEFYWTIRIMSGPKILRLRKRIREEVGMENLR